MDEPMFEVREPSGEIQDCARCGAEVCASLDGLRAAGWIAYDGQSWTGKTLRVRTCPACRRRGMEETMVESPAATPLFKADDGPVYPDDYRACSQVCGAALGERCFSLSSNVANGRPDGVRTYMPQPHTTRKLRVKRGKA